MAVWRLERPGGNNVDDSVSVRRIPQRADRLPTRRATDRTEGGAFHHLDVLEPEFVTAVRTSPPHHGLNGTRSVGQPDRVDLGIPFSGFGQKQCLLAGPNILELGHSDSSARKREPLTVRGRDRWRCLRFPSGKKFEDGGVQWRTCTGRMVDDRRCPSGLGRRSVVSRSVVSRSVVSRRWCRASLPLVRSASPRRPLPRSRRWPRTSPGCSCCMSRFRPADPEVRCSTSGWSLLRTW